MRIHTTQNLLSSTNSTNIQRSNKIRTTLLKESSMPTESAETIIENSNVSFGKKNPLKDGKLLDKAVKKIKKTLGERVANSKSFEKLSNSSSFGKFLEFVNKQEVMIQAMTALAICCVVRPLTIMAIPSDKNKKDLGYAAGHSFSSGIWGFIIPFLFIKPLAKGYNHAKDPKNIHKYIKNIDKLKERLPHIDEKTLLNADKTIKPLSEGKDYAGKKIIASMNDVQMIPLPKHIQSEACDDTLKELMPNIDLALSKAQGKWVDKAGNELLPKIEDLYFVVEKADKKGNMEQHYFPYLTAQEDLLTDVFKGLKIDSIKDANGNRLHPTEWKFDNDFKIGREHFFSSHWNDSGSSCIPLSTGFRKEDGARQCFLNNADKTPGALGTPITAEMAKADKVNNVLDKLGGWLPDIVSAYPRATATIAIIPFVLKNVFGLEKTKKQPPAANTDNGKAVA